MVLTSIGLSDKEPRMLPKTVRVIVLANSSGYITAMDAAQYRIRKHDEARKGFHQIASFTLPIRRLGKGWNVYYRYWATWAIHNMGI